MSSSIETSIHPVPLPYVDRVAPPDIWADIQRLESLLDQKGIVAVDGQGHPLSRELRWPAIEALLGPEGQAQLAANRPYFDNLLSQPLSDQHFDAVSQLLEAYASWLPGAPLQLQNLGERLRMDELVMAAMGLRMRKQKTERTELSEQLKCLTAELKIFSVIQSKVNVVMADKGTFKLEDSSFNLFDRTLYDLDADSWEKSPEHRLLSSLDTFKPAFNGSAVVTVRHFLEGMQSATSSNESGSRQQKVSGPMTDLKAQYAWDKDNNPLANFSQALSDRTRIVNDKVTEQTTLLNDVGSRYTTSTEVMMKFVETWFSMLSKILQN
ncbi:virulence-associated V antigen [Pseudomonas carassii]|uniref:Virulence-associated V antigen n=1 Tax=Pseudomonas carassii TaxID=3115855 RepID=A0ABU7H936_9PSED|nr:virulence-associated V antigen [Pseudomonas sp. 137P]MEE1887847.1 virulence-associated V antigen [Pseudomonas sp. 137P]